MYTETKLLPKEFIKIILENESGLVECLERILERGVEKGFFKIKHSFWVANIIVYLLSIEPLRGWNLRKHYKVEEINKLIEDHIITKVLHFFTSIIRQGKCREYFV